MNKKKTKDKLIVFQLRQFFYWLGVMYVGRIKINIVKVKALKAMQVPVCIHNAT